MMEDSDDGFNDRARDSFKGTDRGLVGGRDG